MSNKREKVIEVKDMVKKFGNFTANDHLTFDIYKGEVFGFLGANGAGKTTAMKMLCGLSKPTSGTIKIAGFDAYSETEKIKKTIGYMSQKFSLYEDLTVEENIIFYGGIYGLTRKKLRQQKQKLLEKLEMENISRALIHNLPLGWKQKLAFSIAIIHNPSIVFLDEPTSGVDPVIRRQFWEMIYEAADQDITVFVTTHYLDEAEYCDRVSIMSAGKIVALGTPRELVENMAARNNTDQRIQGKSVEEVFIQISRQNESF